MDQTYTNNSHRNLTNEEVGQLIMQGCSAEDWNLIEVSERFEASSLKDVKFTGTNRIGKFDSEVKLFGGITFPTGIHNAWLHNCIIEDNVLIHNVRNYIANYTIRRNTIIHNITTLAVDGVSTFGNGTKVETLNEGGGREVPIYDHLSTHVAYILTLYRHRPKVIQSLFALVDHYVDYTRSSSGEIGADSQILNCDTLKNIKCGPATTIEGARKLDNGSLNSSYEAPITIGDNVIMEDFIVCSGSKITDATLVSKCFIGQGCRLDKHYSAENSLFFANCQGFHGEACSIFAGPYTVTHHKSTLLIAGMFSFMNAGSGSNQSNHMYKLGPIHQGIVERGAKTTSDSYVLWPSHIGAFSLVMGRHYQHADTSQFPFSYLIEKDNETFLAPAVNLRSIGTIRDSKKFPLRDERTDSKLLDYINFNLLSPYTVQKMLKGSKILEDIKENNNRITGNQYVYEKMNIEKHALNRGIQLYEMAIWKFLGNSLITKLQQGELEEESQLSEILKKETPIGSGRWIDLSGLICPLDAMEQLLHRIEENEIASLEEIGTTLRTLHQNYYTYEWTWAYDTFVSFYGKEPSAFRAQDAIYIINKWMESVLSIDKMLHKDASKEYSLSKMTGFGVDGKNKDKKLDFENVRGDFSKDPTVVEIRNHMKVKEKLGKEMKAILEKCMMNRNIKTI